MLKLYLVSALTVLAGLTTPGLAEERKLTTDEINAILPTVVVLGEDTRQTFSARGATTYTDRGRDSYGSWEARGDQYCSQWPPADGWACYDVFLDGDKLTWVGESGHRTLTTIKPKG